MSLTKATYSMVSGACVNVLDYGADPTGATDSTAAIAAAVAVGGEVYFPRGAYKCNIEITNSSGVYLCGETQGQYGVEGARLIPADDTKPVIDVVGPVIGCIVENFILDSQLDSNYSHTGIGLRVKASTPDFVWRSAFRHLFIRGFEDGLIIDCDVNLSEVFDNDFQDIECIGISRYSFKTRGVYNRFGKLFATQVGIIGGPQPTADYAFYHDGSNCFFDSAVSSGRQYWAGTGNYVGNAVIEAIDGPGIGTAGYPAMELSGTQYNTWEKIRLNGVPTSKYQVGVRIAGAKQTIGDILIEGANHPATGLLFAGGSSGILGNATQPGALASQPENWNFLGDVTGAINGGGPTPFPWVFKSAWDGSSFIVPDATWNLVLDPNAAPLAAGTLVMPQTNPPLDGQTLTISTTKTITSMTFETQGIYSFWSGATINQTFNAGESKSFIFRLSNYTWYPL
jgi:hypothetical protein